MAAEDQAHPDLVEFLIAGKPIEVYIPSIRSVAEGAYILQEVFVGNEYFRHGVQIRPGGTVVDVGAHIGMFGAKALSSVPGGDIHYIGVEPCQPTFKALQLNLLGSNGQGKSDSFFHYNVECCHVVEPAAERRICRAYPENVKLLNKAVSSKPGNRPITYYPCMPGNSTLRPIEKQQLQGPTMAARFQGAQQLQVPVITLDQLLEDAGVAGLPIDLLKIDVEGEELEVLRGLSSSGWANVQQVVLEVHDCLPGEYDEPYADIATATGNQMHAAQPLAAAPSGASPAAVAAAVLSDLPGSLGCTATSGIHGDWTNLASPPSAGGDCQGQSAPAGAAAMLPRDRGRVIVIANMLRGLGFKVAVECSMVIRDRAVNYIVYARRAESMGAGC